MKPLTFAVDETTLVFAFRYALGRRSTAPSRMAALLKNHWDKLQGWTQTQIHREIAQAIQHDLAGDGCDEQRWREVLALPAKAETTSP